MLCLLCLLFAQTSVNRHPDHSPAPACDQCVPAYCPSFPVQQVMFESFDTRSVGTGRHRDVDRGWHLQQGGLRSQTHMLLSHLWLHDASTTTCCPLVVEHQMARRVTIRKLPCWLAGESQAEDSCFTQQHVMTISGKLPCHNICPNWSCHTSKCTTACGVCMRSQQAVHGLLALLQYNNNTCRCTQCLLAATARQHCCCCRCLCTRSTTHTSSSYISQQERAC